MYQILSVSKKEGFCGKRNLTKFFLALLFNPFGLPLSIFRFHCLVLELIVFVVFPKLDCSGSNIQNTFGGQSTKSRLEVGLRLCGKGGLQAKEEIDTTFEAPGLRSNSITEFLETEEFPLRNHKEPFFGQKGRKKKNAWRKGENHCQQHW